MFQSFACLSCLSIGTPRDKSMAKQILGALDENEAIELLLKVVDKETRAHMNTYIHTYIACTHPSYASGDIDLHILVRTQYISPYEYGLGLDAYFCVFCGCGQILNQATQGPVITSVCMCLNSCIQVTSSCVCLHVNKQ